ncbi:MAG: hypothetical protein H0X26_03475 [Alphaproteobacteria bacterium]|nr:hypothetical protein [Alphaproteobacteria bacterium]
MNKFMYIAPLVLGLVAVSAPAYSQAQQKVKVGSNLGTTPPKFGLLADVQKLSDSMAHIIQETDNVANSIEGDFQSQYDSINSFEGVMTDWFKCGPGAPNCDTSPQNPERDTVVKLQGQFQDALTDYKNNSSPDKLPTKDELKAVTDALKAAVDNMDPKDKATLLAVTLKIKAARANLMKDQIAMQKLMPLLSAASNYTPPTKK